MTYSYNQNDNLAAISSPARLSATPVNGGGLRATRTSSGVTTNFVWATLGIMPVILDDGAHRYLYGPDLAPYAHTHHTAAAPPVTSATPVPGPTPPPDFSTAAPATTTQ